MSIHTCNLKFLKWSFTSEVYFLNSQMLLLHDNREMSYISREISLFCQKPFFWYFLFAALVDARVHSLGFAIPLASRQKEVTMLKSRLHFGGSLHAKTHRPDLLASICCVSAGLSLIHVACLLGYPWFQVLCSTVWGLWCDCTIDTSLLPGFASFMTP